MAEDVVGSPAKRRVAREGDVRFMLTCVVALQISLCLEQRPKLWAIFDAASVVFRSLVAAGAFGQMGRPRGNAMPRKAYTRFSSRKNRLGHNEHENEPSTGSTSAPLTEPTKLFGPQLSFEASAPPSVVDGAWRLIAAHGGCGSKSKQPKSKWEPE